MGMQEVVEEKIGSEKTRLGCEIMEVNIFLVNLISSWNQNSCLILWQPSSNENRTEQNDTRRHEFELILHR